MTPADAEMAQRLSEELDRSRALGFLGPGPVVDHIEHARSFVPLLDVSSSVLDLGSGGGVPGLVLATDCPGVRFVLVDAMEKRCRFLRSAVISLDLSSQVEVRCGRAEDLARSAELRGRFDTVVTRSFGPPAVTAECAVGFLGQVGGRVLVSEPPEEVAETDARWPTDGLATLGLRRGPRSSSHRGSVQVLELVEVGLERFPRRTGVPAKRPVF